MTDVTIAPQGDLFCIPSGDGYTSLGFDVCIDRTCRYAAALGRPDLVPVATRGTFASYAEYLAVCEAAKARHDATGEPLTADLSPQLKGLEGQRVEVVDGYGESRRFKVGKSTGWIPCHLELHNARSHGGCPADRSYKSVRVV